MDKTIKEQILDYNILESQVKLRKTEIDDKLRRIFKTIHEIQEKNRQYKIMGKNYFYQYSTYDGFRLEGNNLYLHYYDYGYDCYDCEEFSIPVEVAETEEKAKEWAIKEIEKLKELRKQEDKQKELEKEKRERAEYERLKEKFEND